MKREVVRLKLPVAQAEPRSEMQLSREGNAKHAKRCSEEGGGTAQAIQGSGTAFHSTEPDECFAVFARKIKSPWLALPWIHREPQMRNACVAQASVAR